MICVYLIIYIYCHLNNIQTNIEGQYRELQDLAATRKHQLQENKRLFEFFREADEVAKWIKEKEAIAGSEDYGTDLEHVQVNRVMKWIP